MSSDRAEVYRLSSASFLAPSISFFRRSGPAYKPTSAAVAFGLTCPGTDAGRTAPATNRLARRLNPSGFMSRVLFRSVAGEVENTGGRFRARPGVALAATAAGPAGR